MSEENKTCQSCGMHVQDAANFHPFAACLMIPMSKSRNEIETFVEKLFTNGQGEKADRLVLADDGPPKKDLGGWCRGAIVNRIEEFLSDS